MAYVNRRINIKILVFQQDEVLAYWYLLLTGEVELYIPAVSVLTFCK